MEIKFNTIIKKFGQQGEKTGWTYIEIPARLANQLSPGNKKSFRVKGKLDAFSIEGIALLPMGDGNFIMALKADVRKALGKQNGASLKVTLQIDEKPYILCPELMDCLADEPIALENFNKQPGSHQRYFSKWVEAAKTDQTKAKRIANAVNAMLIGMDYGEMIRSLKNEF